MFPDNLFYLLFNSTVVIIPYRTPRLNKIFGSYFLVFGKCGVTPHGLYRGSLTLRNRYTNTNVSLAVMDLLNTCCYSLLFLKRKQYFCLCRTFLQQKRVTHFAPSIFRSSNTNQIIMGHNIRLYIYTLYVCFSIPKKTLPVSFE